MLKTCSIARCLTLTTLWLIAWCAGLLRAQGRRPLSHQTWTTEEGLPASGVHSILQSHDGYLWLATEAGAVRFDGYTFTTFRDGTEPGFAGSDVSAIAEDTSGNLWFGTADGLTELHQGSFRRMTEYDGMPSGAVLALATPKDGSLLALTAAGVQRFDGIRFHPLAGAPASVSGLFSSPERNVWLVTDSAAIPYKQNATLHFAANEPLLGVERSASGALWTWTTRAVHQVRAGTAGLDFRAGSELPAGRVTALRVDRRGSIWIGMSHGLFVLTPERPRMPLAVDALRGEAVASLLEDREGNIFVGTEGSGLHVLRPRTFRSEAAASGEAVTSVVSALDGKIWFGTKTDGVQILGSAGGQTPVAPSSLTSPFVLSLAAGSQGDVWVGTPDGLNRVHGSSVEQFTAANGLPDDFIRSVLVDDDGVVWAGTRRGLARVDKGSVTTLTTADGLGSDSIGPLLADSAKDRAERGVWIGTSSGLSHVHRQKLESFRPDVLPGHLIVTALESDGQAGVWVGIHGAGLSYFASGKFRRILSASLPDEVIAVLRDENGSLWIRGTHAIYRVMQSALLACTQHAAPCEAAVAVYNTVDGMPSDTLAGEGTPAAWRGNAGELWFATRKGLAVADSGSVTFNAVPPPVAVAHFRINEQDAVLGGRPIRIAPGSNRYAFDFVALSYTAPSKNRYRYMLEGFDSDWTEAGPTRNASYTNLPSRRYVFRVQAANNDGVWNRDGASVSFEVLRPFYRRWWFYCLSILLLAVLTFAIYRLRVLSIERRFALVLNERNRVAREVHDTLAQDFVSVSLQLDLASTFLRANQVGQANTQLQATKKLVKEGLEEARQSIWNLRADTALDSLPARLTALAKRYADSPFRTRLKMGGAYHRFSPRIESEVFRIAQESLSNVERHSAATEAFVELHYDQAAVRLTVRDNGKGFSEKVAEQRQGHYGVRGMKERAAALNATFTIQSEPEQGTTVTLIVSADGEGAQT